MAVRIFVLVIVGLIVIDCFLFGNNLCMPLVILIFYLLLIGAGHDKEFGASGGYGPDFLP